MENATYRLTAEEVQQIQYTFINKVYSWMALALGITGGVAFLTVNSQTVLDLVFSNPLVFYGLLLAELGIVVYLISRIQTMEAQTAVGWFLLYSGLNGLTLSVLLLMYTPASIASTFMVTAITFGSMSLYGYTTKRDLTTIGNLAFMALIGIIIASIVNIFFFSETLYWLISYVGVLVFVALTAWDTQKLKKMSLELADNQEVKQRAAIVGALMLYLDFINMFIFLLRILGNRR